MELSKLSDKEKISIYKKSEQGIIEAKEKHNDLIRSLYPKDSYVRWYVRPYFKAGIVTEGGYNPSTNSISVQATDGKYYSVHMSAVINAAEAVDA